MTLGRLFVVFLMYSGRNVLILLRDPDTPSDASIAAGDDDTPSSETVLETACTSGCGSDGIRLKRH